MFSPALKGNHEAGCFHDDIRPPKLALKKYQEATSFISISTDICTSLSTETYITVTAHFILPSFDLQACVLETKVFPERHTGLINKEKITEITDEFKVSNSVMSIVHDQAANIELCSRHLYDENGWLNMHCTAHCLQLCHQTGLDVRIIASLLTAAKKLVTHFKHSVVCSEELKRRCIQMEMKSFKVIQMCPTRWNSSYHMLERLDYLRWPITAVLSDPSVITASYHYLDLKAEQWDLCKQLIPVLKPFDVATTCLSYEENVSVSFVVPILHGLKESLQKDSASVELPAVKDFKEIVLSEIERTWDLTSPALTKLLVLSNIMDPRFKLKYIKTEKHEEVCAEMEKVPSDRDRDKDKEDTAAKPTVKKRKTVLDVLLGPESEEDNVLSPCDELDKYLLAPRDINPLHWWAKKFFVLSPKKCSPQKSGESTV